MALILVPATCPGVDPRASDVPQLSGRWAQLWLAAAPVGQRSWCVYKSNNYRYIWFIMVDRYIQIDMVYGLWFMVGISILSMSYYGLFWFFLVDQTNQFMGVISQLLIVVYGGYIYIVAMVFKPTCNWGAAPCYTRMTVPYNLKLIQIFLVKLYPQAWFAKTHMEMK